MKKTITLLTILTLLLGCTKENSNSTVTPQNNKLSFTPYYLPNKDGIIIASASRIILHTTDFVNLSANIYGVDGAIISNPSLTWNSEDNKVVTASNGNITAVSLGDTRVKISDGVHSDGYVNITVVSDTTNIPNEVANIVFDKLIVIAPTDTTFTLPNYIVTNNKGEAINKTITFDIDGYVGENISGNSITVNSNPGLGKIVAYSNGKKIRTNLDLFISNNLNNDNDTLRTFSLTSDWPELFRFYNVESTPIRILVKEVWNLSKLWRSSRVYTTSPDNITILYPNVVNSTNEGKLISVGPGNTPISLKYKNSKDNDLEFYASVNYDFTGSWQGSIDDKVLNFCVDKGKMKSIMYSSYGGNEGMFPVNGMSRSYNNFTPEYYGKSSLIANSIQDNNVVNCEAGFCWYTGEGFPGSNGSSLPFFINTAFVFLDKDGAALSGAYNNWSPGLTGIPGYSAWYTGNPNKLSLKVGGKDMIITRGAGNCDNNNISYFNIYDGPDSCRHSSTIMSRDSFFLIDTTYLLQNDLTIGASGYYDKICYTGSTNPYKISIDFVGFHGAGDYNDVDDSNGPPPSGTIGFMADYIDANGASYFSTGGSVNITDFKLNGDASGEGTYSIVFTKQSDKKTKRTVSGNFKY